MIDSLNISRSFTWSSHNTLNRWSTIWRFNKAITLLYWRFFIVKSTWASWAISLSWKQVVDILSQFSYFFCYTFIMGTLNATWFDSNRITMDPLWCLAIYVFESIWVISQKLLRATKSTVAWSTSYIIFIWDIALSIALRITISSSLLDDFILLFIIWKYRIYFRDCKLCELCSYLILISLIWGLSCLLNIIYCSVLLLIYLQSLLWVLYNIIKCGITLISKL